MDYIKGADELTTMFDFPTKGILQVGSVGVRGWLVLVSWMEGRVV